MRTNPLGGSAPPLCARCRGSLPDRPRRGTSRPSSHLSFERYTHCTKMIPMPASPRSRVPMGLVALGAGAILVGSLGLTLGWGNTVGARTGSNTTTTPAAAASERPAAFLAELVQALRTGNTSFLLARVDPALISRYGEQACRSAIPGLFDPTVSLRLPHGVGPGLVHLFQRRPIGDRPRRLHVHGRRCRRRADRNPSLPSGARRRSVSHLHRLRHPCDRHLTAGGDRMRRRRLSVRLAGVAFVAWLASWALWAPSATDAAADQPPVVIGNTLTGTYSSSTGQPYPLRRLPAPDEPGPPCHRARRARVVAPRCSGPGRPGRPNAWSRV